jgi:hypothetical protein
MHPLVTYILMIVAGFVGYQWCRQLAKKAGDLPPGERNLLTTMRWAGIALIFMGAALALRYLLAG